MLVCHKIIYLATPDQKELTRTA